MRECTLTQYHAFLENFLGSITPQPAPNLGTNWLHTQWQDTIAGVRQKDGQRVYWISLKYS